MLWHSDLENHFNDDPPRETLVSPFVTALSYDYFDTDFNKWTTETVAAHRQRRQPAAAAEAAVHFRLQRPRPARP